VGSFYQNFDQVSDLEVRELLADVIETRKTL
jgi:predicted phosphoribosyltransferase